MSIYSLTEENAYFAQIIRSDMAKGHGLQRAVNDVIACGLLMGRGLASAQNTAAAAMDFAGFKTNAVLWSNS